MNRIVLACLLPLAAAGWPWPTSAAELLGPSAVIVAAGTSPDDVAIADLDRDGVLDLLVTNLDSRSVSVLLGDGRGGFVRLDDVAVGDAPEAISAADFDADGIVDFVVANRVDNSLSLALGEGSGRFRAALPIPGVGPAPIDLAVGDYDANGALDLAVVNRDAGSVSILLNDGLGGFGAPSTVGGLGPFPISIATGDFNRDGAADLAVANLQGDSVSILLGNGLGGFSAPAGVGVGSFPIFVTCGDLDRDGASDLVVLNAADNSLSVLLGSGDGSFLRRMPDIEVGSFPIAASLGDLDGDGVADLVVVNLDGNSLSVLLGDGSGGFVRRCRAAGATDGCAEVAVSSPRAVAIGDLDIDGSPDVVAANEFGNSVSVLRGDGLGGFGGARASEVGEAPQAVAAGDFNGDGAADLAVANALGDSLGILLSDRIGGFVPGPDVGDEFEVPVAIVAGDFDRDGYSDLAVANSGSVDRHVSILRGGGDGSFTRIQDVRLDRNLPVSLGAGDFDGDGDLDLVVVHATSFLFEGNLASILLGRGDGSFDPHSTVALRDGSGDVGVGDFDGDGDLDLAVTNVATDSVRLFLGDGDGDFVRLTPDLAVGDGPASVAVDDLDGDGMLDLAIPFSNDDRVGIFLGQGDGRFLRQSPDLAVGSGPSHVEAGDFNADERLDLVVTNASSDAVSILLGRGDGSFLRTPDLVVGDEPVGLAVADFDADGAVDVAVANRLDHSVSALFNQLGDRADLNGSNRIDGFDIATISRLAGTTASAPAYRRNADVNLDGLIDGDDLCLSARRFGRLNHTASLLRASIEGSHTEAPNTVTLQPAAAEGDRLTVQVLVHDADRAASAADFAVSFAPDDQGVGQVVELVGYRRGTYLAGGVAQVYTLDDHIAGQIGIGADRLPPRDALASGDQSLVSLIFRARRPGTARLAFGPFRRAAPTLLFVEGCGDTRGCAVDTVRFAGDELTLRVDSSAGGPPGQRIGFAPDVLDFGQVAPGTTARRIVRLSNFGYSDLEIRRATPSLPEFTSFLGGDPFTVPPFGFVELTVEFTPTSVGLYSGELVVDSDDEEARVPLVGSSR